MCERPLTLVKLVRWVEHECPSAAAGSLEGLDEKAMVEYENAEKRWYDV